MKRILFLLAMHGAALNAQADNKITVSVVRGALGDKQSEINLPFDFDKLSYLSKSAWRSPRGIECEVTMIKQANPPQGGSFTCITPEGYKAQVGFDCSINTNEKNSVYMFFGKVGDAQEIGNFYIWCK